jgi:hypothetical protein
LSEGFHCSPEMTGAYQVPFFSLCCFKQKSKKKNH